MNQSLSLEVQKSTHDKLSDKTLNAIWSAKQKQIEEKEFEDNLGKWQIGNYVDEFGDKTGDDYSYTIILGEHENRLIPKSDIYVKASSQDERLFFELYNKSMTMRESLPDKKFGKIKIKYPSGDLKSEKVFFFKNTVSESTDNKETLIYNYIKTNDGELKLLLDLATASNYHYDKYQFSISKNILADI